MSPDSSIKTAPARGPILVNRPQRL